MSSPSSRVAVIGGGGAVVGICAGIVTQWHWTCRFRKGSPNRIILRRHMKMTMETKKISPRLPRITDQPNPRKSCNTKTFVAFLVARRSLQRTELFDGQPRQGILMLYIFLVFYSHLFLMKVYWSLLVKSERCNPCSMQFFHAKCPSLPFLATKEALAQHLYCNPLLFNQESTISEKVPTWLI